MILAIETSCDETAAAVIGGRGEVLSDCISSQMSMHAEFGGVVPELASREHLRNLRPVIEQAVCDSGAGMDQFEAFAATCGPGLASSLVIGSSTAKAMALAAARPFIAVNHMEGHLLSPFIGLTDRDGPEPCIGLVVSGGHTMLVHLLEVGRYQVLGSTRDDAAGEAFDKVAKLLGLGYPGGPVIEQRARDGDPRRFDFPRGLMGADSFDFSFSGLKTSVRYLLDKLGGAESDAQVMADLCASFQAAVVDVLVAKAVRAAGVYGGIPVALSGGVACNLALRTRLQQELSSAGIVCLLPQPRFTTDNAAMIGYAAWCRHRLGFSSPLDHDIDPNWRLDQPAGGLASGPASG